MIDLKKRGFQTKGIADLMGISPNEIYELREMWDIHTSFKMVDTCAGEFEAKTPYYYSTYDEEDEVEVTHRKKGHGHRLWTNKNWSRY